MINSEDELKQQIHLPDRKKELQPKFRRMIDRVLVNDDPSKREAAAERLSEILTKIAVAFVETGEKDTLIENFLNKQGFRKNLEQTLPLLRRFNIPAALIFVDVDYLKRFNDTQGHQKADKMLAIEGQCITDSIRAVDFAGRFGGDEFVVCVVGADLDGGEIVAQRIEADNRKRMLEIFPDYPYPQTLSIGIAELMPDDTTESLIERADQAMYQAKRERDRIVSVRKDSQSGRLDFKMVTPHDSPASS